MGGDGNICKHLFYEHHSAVLIIWSIKTNTKIKIIRLTAVCGANNK